ncbi:MAG: SDR family oxidoreductase [Desulfobacterales bacterium]|nr:SDR family oxidoreductase [Desulfobacterales bacterium]
MSRNGQPEEIGNAAVFLASDDASYLTGENLSVDGGSLACMYHLIHQGSGIRLAACGLKRRSYETSWT